MANALPPDSTFDALLRQLDDLLAEASRLRDQIQAAMTAKVESPFWPERRRERQPVSSDRRKN